MRFKVLLTTRKMGMQCASCKQDHNLTVEASDMQEAVAKAKAQTGFDPEIYKFSIRSVKEI